MAARRDENSLDFSGVRRGLDRSDEDCGPPDDRFPRQSENGAHEPRRGLHARLDDKRLPGYPDGGHSQRCALYDAQVHLREEIGPQRSELGLEARTREKPRAPVACFPCCGPPAAPGTTSLAVSAGESIRLARS